MVTGWHRIASPPAQRRERKARRWRGVLCLSNRPISHPTTCFPSSRQTDPFVGGEGHGARSLFPRGTATQPGRTDIGLCAQLIVAFEAVLHAPPAIRRPEFVTPVGFNNKTERGGRVEKPAGRAMRPIRRRWRLYRADGRKKSAVVVAPLHVAKRFQRRRKTKRRQRSHAPHRHAAKCNHVAVSGNTTSSFDRFS